MRLIFNDANSADADEILQLGLSWLDRNIKAYCLDREYWFWSGGFFFSPSFSPVQSEHVIHVQSSISLFSVDKSTSFQILREIQALSEMYPKRGRWAKAKSACIPLSAVYRYFWSQRSSCRQNVTDYMCSYTEPTPLGFWSAIECHIAHLRCNQIIEGTKGYS